MKVKVQFFFRTPDGKTRKKVISYINPNATDENVAELIRKLNACTQNDLLSIIKIVNDYLDEESQVIEEDNNFVTDEEIADILDGVFVEVEDAEGITEIEIGEILDGTYTQTDDADGLTDKDIEEILGGI